MLTLMDTATERGKLSLGTKLGFGVCDMGGNLFFTVIAFWFMNYLTDVVGLVASLAAVVYFIARLWDAITDPFMGIISDKTHTRWGRRRPYLLFGSVPLFLTMWQLFSSPGAGFEGQTALFIWAVVSFCLLSTAYTVVNIPYSSLTPELTVDYKEKTALNGYRMSFAVLGTLIAAGASKPLIDAFSTPARGFSVMGFAFGMIMMVTALITFFSVREPESLKQAAGPKGNILQSYKRAFKNKPYLLILFPWILNMTGLTVVSGTMIYYFKYIFHRENMVTPAMIALIVTALIFIPLWVKISEKIGKRIGYMIGLGIISFALVVNFFVGHIAGIYFVYGLMVFAGVGLSTGYIFPWAIVPDTIEYDAIKTGERKEGIFYGMWTFSSKVGQALAGGLIGGILSLTNYVPEGEQGSAAIMGIRLLFGLVPAAIYLTAAVIIYFYPLSEEKYNAALAEAK